MIASRLVLALTSVLLPKPVILVLEDVLDRAALIAEVRILAVTPAAAGGGAGRAGSVTLRVTDDPCRVVRGFPLLGKTLELAPVGYGSWACTEELRQIAGTGRDVLVVVGGDRRVTLLGLPASGATVPTWDLHGWCDFNAVMFRSDDAELKRSCGLQGMPETVRAPGHAMAARFGAQRRQLLARVADELLGTPTALTREEFRQAVDELGDEAAAGEAAEARLCEHGGRYLAELKALEKRALRETTRHRLRRIVATLEPFGTAAAVAAAARADAVDAEAALLVEALPGLAGATRARAIAHLRVLASRAHPPLRLPDGDGATVAAWRRRARGAAVGLPPVR